MKMNKAMATLWATLLLPVLAGCGGGGSDSSSAASSAIVSASAAQGAYEGTTSTGRAFDMLLLEDGQYWTIYGQISSGAFYVYGLIQGTGQANNGSFSSSDLKDFYYTGSTSSGSLSASYNPGVSLNGSVTSFNSTSTFTASALTSSTYNYNSSPALSDITGAWNMTLLSGASATLNIAANGTFSGTSGGCSFSGTIVPRASGKNIFNVSTTFGAAPCALPGQTSTGIGVSYILANAQRELLVAAVDGSRTHGTVLLGVR